MTNEELRLKSCIEQIRAKTDSVPTIGIVLGSGLGEYGRKIYTEVEISYSEIQGFPVSTVPGHAGRYLFGKVGEVPVVCMQGRVHSYEGYDMKDVVLPIRIMGELGAKMIILTNAAGGVNKDFAPGTLMVIEDQISSFVRSPLIGANPDSLGVRFPDMTEIYSQRMRKLIFEVGKEKDIPLCSGVYLQFSGPQYETPAEIRMARALGADAVGMSTCVEAIAARHMGVELCGISCITNYAAGISGECLSHEEVQNTADEISEKFEALITGIVEKAGKLW